jgi:hypothetical protein
MQVSVPKKINDTGPLGYFNLPLNMIRDRFQSDAAAIWLYDEPKHASLFACGQGFRFPGLASCAVRALDKLVERAIFERRLQIVSIPGALSDPPASLDLLKEESFTCAVVSPLEVSGRAPGILGAFYKGERRPVRPENSLRDLLGSILASAIGSSNSLGIGTITEARGLRAGDDAFLGWAQLLDMRLPGLFAHCRRVAVTALRLGEALRLDLKELVTLYRGALLHDLGKIGLPDTLLQARPAPDETGRKLLSRHPDLGRGLLADVPHLHPVLDLLAYHHEHWDGTGTPCGLKGAEIPRAARIVAVANEWNKTLSSQPIREGAGKRFDPQVVEMFLSMDL